MKKRSQGCHLPIPNLLACSLLGFALIASVHSAPILTDDQLLDFGNASFEKKQHDHAAVYYFAYIQRNPALMQADRTFAAQVEAAYEFCDGQLDKAAPTAAANVVADGLGRTLSAMTLLPPLPKRPTSTPSLAAGSPLVLRGGGKLYFTYSPYSALSRSLRF
jgi:hypothetical protein